MKKTRVGCLVLGAICLPFSFMCLMGPVDSLLLAVDFLFGWMLFPFNVLPSITVNIEACLSAIVCLAMLTTGVHFFLRWLYAQRRLAGDPASPRSWRLNWTVIGLAVVMLMFVAGVSAVGVVHQVVWLSRTPAVWFSSEHLRMMGLGTHMYVDKHGMKLPPGATFDEHGRMMHGWMCRVLPFVAYEQWLELNERIDLTLPWDHPNNAAAFGTIVREYQCHDYAPLQKKDGAGYAMSHYASNVHVIGGERALPFKSITDGTSTTLLIGESAGNYRPWGYPVNWRDPSIGLNRSPDGFGNAAGRGANFVFADGMVRFLSNKISPNVLKALSTPAGGEIVSDD